MKIAAAALIFALCPVAHAEDSYRIRVVDFPGAVNTYVFALNNAGQFVGAEIDAAGAAKAIHSDGRQVKVLALSGAAAANTGSSAYSINNRGDIAGAYKDAGGVHHGFLRHADGATTQIDFPGANSTQAYGVNDHETVIGIYADAQNNFHAFVLRAGHYRNADLTPNVSASTTPLSINDLEEIVGEYATTPNTNGFGYFQKADTSFALTTAPGSVPEGTLFISINNRQQILGAYSDAAGTQHNFLKTGNSFRPFDLPTRFLTSVVSAQTINDRGDIVGYYQDAGSLAHGFVATRGGEDD